jgi:putative Mg2+ transporter-C (MgtC) family protein
MPIDLDWREIALRLIFTVIAGGLIGFNRGEQGRPAGLRTTLLVCLAASISMIQVNVMLATAGRHPDSFIMLDLMRLPLGILSGMGFIGAGAIMRKEDRVLGITTAATLWFTTVIGLCFGGGQTGLGFAALALGLFVLEALKYVERQMHHERHSVLTLVVVGEEGAEKRIRAQLLVEQFKIVACSISYDPGSQKQELRYEISWRARTSETEVPSLISRFSKDAQITELHWNPALPSHGLS